MRIIMATICGISDTHGHEFSIDPCDILCHCGDWSPLEIQNDFCAMLKWMEKFITHLCELPCSHVVIIAGNHDRIMDSILGNGIFEDVQYRLGLTSTFIGDDGIPVTRAKVHYLDRESIVLDGLKFWGSPVTKQVNRYCKYWAFETNNPQYDIPPDADVVLTHQPSDYKGLGNTNWHCMEPSKRLGSPSLTEAVTGSNAVLHLCGHIHTGNHECVTYSNYITRGYNVSMLDEGYEKHYEPLYIRL